MDRAADQRVQLERRQLRLELEISAAKKLLEGLAKTSREKRYLTTSSKTRRPRRAHCLKFKQKGAASLLGAQWVGRPDDARDVDSGYAWVVLAVVFVINASTLGTARVYGLIFDRLARQDRPRSEAALPFTVMGATENVAGPLTSYLLTRSKDSWRSVVVLGCALSVLGHLGASLLDSLAGQLVSIGLVSGFGLSLVGISFFQLNNSYFVRYRSRALGLGLTGAVFGTWYISPICQYVLDAYSTSACYRTLALIMLPNVPLALLLKPKHASPTTREPGEGEGERRVAGKLDLDSQKQIPTIALSVAKTEREQRRAPGLWSDCKRVVASPMFHLIWPTQLLFCWYNFVFGMIIVDFGTDRGLESQQASQLIPIWAFGQLCGRIGLGALVDLKYISYELFTAICFTLIGCSALALNKTAPDLGLVLIPLLVFVLSAFISNLYILFNGLVAKHMDAALGSLTIGISSFAGSLFLLPRASVIGYYRDTAGNYDAMLVVFAAVAFSAALVWLIVTLLRSRHGETAKTKLHALVFGPRSSICVAQLGGQPRPNWPSTVDLSGTKQP